MGIEFPCCLDQAHGEVGMDAPVALFVGIGQRGPGNPATDAEMEQFGLMGAQTGFDVAQALAIGQLRESHAKELIEMRESLGWILGRKPPD